MLFCGVNSEGTVDGYAALVLSGQISNSDFILYIGSSNGLTLVRWGVGIFVDVHGIIVFRILKKKNARISYILSLSET